MRLRFHTTYDRFKAGGIYDVSPNLCSALVGGFADVVKPTIEDVKREHDHRCLKLMAGAIGVPHENGFGEQIKKSELKDALIDYLTDE